MIGHYRWAGGQEALLRFGPDDGPVVVVLLPLFEELNRTRAFGVSILRALARRGLAGVLPDLPGQVDSLVYTEKLCPTDLQQAVSDLAQSLAGPVFGVAIRSGALFDAALPRRWHLSPQTGAELARALQRLRKLGDGISFAGNTLPDDLLAAIEATPLTPAQRTVRLEGDSAPADLHLPGAPLWHRAEPDNDPDLAEQLAADIYHWVQACAG